MGVSKRSGAQYSAVHCRYLAKVGGKAGQDKSKNRPKSPNCKKHSSVKIFLEQQASMKLTEFAALNHTFLLSLT